MVGLPRSLSGREGPAAVKVRELAAALAARVAPVPVRLQDERLTTVAAEAMLRDRGKKGASRTGRGRPGCGSADPAARPGHRAGDRASTRRDRHRRVMSEPHEDEYDAPGADPRAVTTADG